MLIPKFDEIDGNTPTIETNGGHGVVKEGKYMGLTFIKKKDKPVEITGWDFDFLNRCLNKFKEDVNTTKRNTN